MDIVLLSRIQFALTIAFHYIFPPISIGLGLLLVIMEGLYLKTKNPLYEQMTRFWAKIFGLIFAMGVATGIVMEFQFGTNWSYYSRFVGDVFGSALAAEGIFAFFLESGFLAILLFGWRRVSPKVHFFSTCMVALGAFFSAIWIIVANSWMQTPAGHHIVTEKGFVRAEIVDFWALVFNPSTVDRLSHVLMGAWQAAAWFVVSVSAYYLLKRKHTEIAKKSMKIALVLAVIASLGQLATGHTSAITVSEYQPAKLAAFEGHYEDQVPGDMYLWGWVDEEAGEVRYGLRFPGALSFLISGDFQRPVTGLNHFPEDERPPVNITFQAYHLMIGIGMMLIGLSFLGIFFWKKGTLFETKWLLMIFVPSVLLPQIANQVGWMAAEIGRQPWIVYGLLKTQDGISRNVSSGEVLGSIIMFTFVYVLLFILFIYLLDQKIKKGPEPISENKNTLLGHRAD